MQPAQPFSSVECMDDPLESRWRAVEARDSRLEAFHGHSAPRLGTASSRYCAGGEGERIAFTSSATNLGMVTMAATEQGLCALRIGDDEQALLAGIMRELPKARFERDDHGLAGLAEAVKSAALGEHDSALLRVDLRGTAFELRVWETLRTIPMGQVRSYSEVASLMGAPKAVRAVARACASNPVALAVPCHRVVRKDGSLGGYRWGLGVKEALLAAERAPKA